jgi:hypothetical protein
MMRYDLSTRIGKTIQRSDSIAIIVKTLKKTVTNTDFYTRVAGRYKLVEENHGISIFSIRFVTLSKKLGFMPKNNIDIILIEELGNTSFDAESFSTKGNRLIENDKNLGQKIKYKKN